MKKIKAIKGIAYISITVLLTLNTLVTWGTMVELAENQKQIIEQQKALIEANLELAEILEDGFTKLSQTSGDSSVMPTVEIHCTMYHRRDGVLIGYSHHAGVLTNLGANWTRQKLFIDNDNANATYIALSNSTSSPSTAWVVLPDEITTGNMSRALGSYTPGGVGVCNITKEFWPTETNSTRLVGLYHAVSGSTLVCADTITVINYENEDEVTIIFTITISYT